MLGLTLALRLRQAGQEVTLYEAAPSLGGLAAAWQVGDVVWDRYYHVIMRSDIHLRRLLQELDLEQEIRWATTRTNFFSGEAMHPLNDAFDYLRLPALGPVDKARLAATILYAARIEDGRRLEAMTAEAWLSRLSGRDTYRRLWHPLLRAKLGDNANQASAAYIWSVIRRFYGARQGGIKRETFGYVPGGYHRILGKLAAKLTAEGAEVKTGAPVSRVQGGRNGIQIFTQDSTKQFDRVVMTCASPIALKTCEGLGALEKARHGAIKYQGIVRSLW